jgi:hypothetical protein
MTLAINQIGHNSQSPSISAVVYLPDALCIGGHTTVTDTDTLETGKLSRGTVLGRITESGNLVLSVKTASDGSQNPVAILVDYADASAGPVGVGVYLAGEYTTSHVIFDPSWTAEKIKLALRDKGIFLKNSQGSEDRS